MQNVALDLPAEISKAFPEKGHHTLLQNLYILFSINGAYTDVQAPVPCAVMLPHSSWILALNCVPLIISWMVPLIQYEHKF